MALSVILTRPRFPENIGMAARACANFGVSTLILVEPELWIFEKAAPLATPQALGILENIRIEPTLRDALAPFSLAYGTTARSGGWRSGIISAAKAGSEIAERRADPDAGDMAIVFGPEDTGLENHEIELCTRLISIPTAPGASSLNLAQAVLLILYECFTASLEHGFHPAQKPKGKKNSPPASIAEQERFFETLKGALLGVGFLPEDNPDWFMLPLRRFFRRSGMRRHEIDLFMGICRDVNRAVQGRDGRGGAGNAGA